MLELSHLAGRSRSGAKRRPRFRVAACIAALALIATGLMAAPASAAENHATVELIRLADETGALNNGLIIFRAGAGVSDCVTAHGPEIPPPGMESLVIGEADGTIPQCQGPGLHFVDPIGPSCVRAPGASAPYAVQCSAPRIVLIVILLEDKNDFVQTATSQRIVIRGGDGNDVFSTGHANDPVSYVGDAGTDMLSYANVPAPVTVTTDSSANDGAAGESDYVAPDIENIVGTAFGDTINTTTPGDTPVANIVLPGGGNDVVRTGAGNDIVGNVFAPADSNGDDNIHGGAGNDLLVDGAGNNTISGDCPTCLGVPGDDRIYTGPGNDVVDGNDGNDLIDAGLGADDVLGGNGHDTIDYSRRPATDRVGVSMDNAPNDGSFLGQINVSLEGDNIHSDVEGVLGTPGNDAVVGDGGNQVFVGYAGDDYFVGNAGDDIFLGLAGDDTSDGGSGRDLLFDSFGALLGGGEDRFYAADNEADQIECGTTDDGFADVVLADSLDTLTRCP